VSKTKEMGVRRQLKIRSGDQVKVISGKDRGKTGRVLRVEPRKNRLFVEGLNMIKRHTKPHQVAGAHTEQRMGGVIEREGPIHISNVMLLDTKGNPTRVGIERVDGNRVRVAKATGARLE
jgi:large subunit ribosomal protein L24